MSAADFPEPVDGYHHRYMWNCTLINQMVWWPTLNEHERSCLSEMTEWNSKYLEVFGRMSQGFSRKGPE